jgi:hypothetical protein
MSSAIYDLTKLKPAQKVFFEEMKYIKVIGCKFPYLAGNKNSCFLEQLSVQQIIQTDMKKVTISLRR